MAYPNKPTAPVLRPSHEFANGLQAAWLFDESTGVTIRDQSGNGLHLAGTNVSDGSWANDGDNRVFCRNRLGAQTGRWNKSAAALNFAAGTDWTEIWWFAYRGGNGVKQRIRSRTGNVMDLGYDQTGLPLQLFQGTVWIGLGESGASGLVQCVAIVHTGSTDDIRVFRDGVFKQETSLNGVANTGEIFVGTAPGVLTEYVSGDWIAGFIHNRALSDAEIASHYSDPFNAWEAQPAVDPGIPGTGNISVFQPRQYLSPGSYRAPPLPHLLDWLGGGR